MTKRAIPKSVRDEAILVCACAASMHPSEPWGPNGVSDEIGAESAAALGPVWAAYMHTLDASNCQMSFQEHSAECAALLEEGWSP